MANELRHADVGTALSKSEWEATGGHIFNSQAAGDIMYASTTSQLTRLGIGSAGQILQVNSGATAPEWTSSPTIVTAILPDSADGATIGSATAEWSDLYMADGAVIYLGADQDVTITHVADDGILINSDNYITFRDSALKIYSSTDGQLDIDADSEVEITATTVDLNGNLDVSGTYTGGGLMTTGGNIVIPNAGNIGSASDTDSIAISSAGVVTMNQIPVFSAGINVSGGTIAGTLATAAQGQVTSLGTLTALTVDDVAVDGKVITMTGSASDTAVFTAGTNGTLSIVTTDAAAAAANIQITADGTVDIDSAGVLTLDSGAAINIEPAGGSAILLDGTISIDAGVVTGATSITSSAYVVGSDTLAEYISDTVGAMVTSNAESGIAVTYEDGDNTLDFAVGTLNQDTTGTATNATHVTVADNESTDENDLIPFIENASATGNVGLESDGDFHYNPNTGRLTATQLAGTLQTASQTAITGVGTITTGTWQGDTVAVNQGGTGATSLNNLITLATHTTGDFVGTITAGTGLTSTGATSGEDVDHSLSVDAAQTGITSLLATNIKIGEDDQTKVDFETDDEIHFYAANVHQVKLVDNAFTPQADSDVDLGASGTYWKDAFIDKISTTGGIELGHASDTTIARSASGKVTIEGKLITTAGKMDMWIPAAAMRPTSSNGCAAITDVETTSGRPDLQVLDFATGADEFAQFSVGMPQSWDVSETCTFQAYWTTASTNTGTVAWAMSGVCCGDNDTIDVAYPTPVVATAKAASGTVEDLNISAESGAVTIDNAAKGELVFFQILRDVSADDHSSDARLIGVKLTYTIEAENDA